MAQASGGTSVEKRKVDKAELEKRKYEKAIEKAKTWEKATVTARVYPVIVQNQDLSPEIVTILHRLSGLKVFRLLVRSNDEIGAITNLDDAFKITTDVHTNVIAGICLDDKTIAAWLPEAEAEIPPTTFYATPPAPVAPRSPRPDLPAPVTPVMPPTPPAPGAAPYGFPGAMPAVGSWSASGFGEADLKVLTRDGRRIAGHYVGIDGLTGLSVISLPNAGLAKLTEPKEETVTVGERIRVLGPQPAPKPDTAPKNALYVKIGETEASVSGTTRSPSGALARIKLKSTKLSTSNIGGIAINDRGETLGIIDAVNNGEATIVPVSLVRSAAKRVMTRQASVPRPWLGIRFEPLEAMPLEKIIHVGWELERARQLVDKQYGILLTSVVPGSPAAENKLKPGDVILSVNNEEVRTGEELSLLLQEAGPGKEVTFSVARPDQAALEAMQIKLGESPDPLFGFRVPRVRAAGATGSTSLLTQGIETIAITSKVAMRFGANGGLLVVSVRPGSEAAKAGIRPGDVIEAVDGRRVVSGVARGGSLLKNPGTSSTFNLVRNKQKLQVTIATHK